MPKKDTFVFNESSKNKIEHTKKTFCDVETPHNWLNMLKNSVKQQEDKLANEDRQQKIDLDKKGWVCQKQWWSQGRRCLTLTDKLSNWKRLPRTIRITSNQNHKDYKQPNELEEKQIQQSAEHEGVCR